MEVRPPASDEMEADILEQICIMQERGVPADPAALCAHFGMSRATLSSHLRRMCRKRYIEEPKYAETIRLTSYGVSMGRNLLYRHNSIRSLLRMTGVRDSTADSDAYRAEHVFTDETVDAICNFIHYEKRHMERKIRNSDLTQLFPTGTYRFFMEMYSMAHIHPREYQKQYRLYQREILLEIGERGIFELQRVQEDGSSLWYRDDARNSRKETWVRAERGKTGERIPANVFDFAIKPDDDLIEGNALIAFTKGREKPDALNGCQLEVQMWK